jgi:tetraacyldisaccharide 4'-kinase
VAGGTGKTPVVAWTVERLRERGHRPGILARGYGPRPRGSDLSDEGLVLRHLLGPGVPQREDRDRARGGRALLAAHPEVDVLILDDGFQHRRLRRDLDLVLVDATCPFGDGRLLPRGLLREPPSALARAHALLVTRSETLSAEGRRALAERLRALTNAALAWAETRPTGLASRAGPLPLEALRGAPVLAACGIGNPEAFVETLRRLGAKVVGLADLGDHRGLGPRGWRALAVRARSGGARALVVTRKDAVKLEDPPEPLWVLDAAVEVTEGRDALLEVLGAAAGGPGRQGSIDRGSASLAGR